MNIQHHGTALERTQRERMAATYADNVALPAFTRRVGVHRAAIDQYLVPAGPTAANSAAVVLLGQTDGRTDRRPSDA